MENREKQDEFRYLNNKQVLRQIVLFNSRTSDHRIVAFKPFLNNLFSSQFNKLFLIRY